MNIQQVRDNLQAAIQTKENFLRERVGSRTDLDSISDEAYLVWNTQAKLVRVHLAELKQLLHDIDICINKSGTVTWAEMH